MEAICNHCGAVLESDENEGLFCPGCGRRYKHTDTLTYRYPPIRYRPDYETRERPNDNG